MDEEAQIKAAETEIKEQVKAYRNLKKVGQSAELDAFLDLLLKTATEKMIWAFISGKVESWEDFLVLKGEIASYIYPVQEIRGADAMEKHLLQQLKQYYPSQGTQTKQPE